MINKETCDYVPREAYAEGYQQKIILVKQKINTCQNTVKQDTKFILNKYR